MQPDLLQQLRDIHTPADPSWWPPALGWWLLAAGMLAGCVLAARWAYDFYRKRQPITRARLLYGDLHQCLVAGAIAPETYVHECNELLKRLLVHGLGRQDARPASDRSWLCMLDECHGSTAFSQGPGRILGNERFHRSPDIQIEPLHDLLTSFLRQVRP